MDNLFHILVYTVGKKCDISEDLEMIRDMLRRSLELAEENVGGSLEREKNAYIYQVT